MGGGASRDPGDHSHVSHASTRVHEPEVRKAEEVTPAGAGGCHQPVASDTKIKTSIDGRIVSTLRELNIARRAAPSKVKSINFERIALRFGAARIAFETIHEIYNEYASENGLDFEGLKAALNGLGTEINESDMREIFYESDMVRDNTLSCNEFIVSLAISYLLGLIKNFNQLPRALVHPPDGVLLTPKETMSSADSSRDGEESARESTINDASPEVIAKALELMVTAYLLFDDDASGTIQISEVRTIMQRHEGGKRPSGGKKLERKASSITTKQIRNERIKELDLDHDGTITFQEFVLTFQKWVGVDD
ncbi:TPA: hypothetical protein N0F65_008541 [Lagenidium giganteum]|uniref:EF-hand domain-containing protein n=1 Tax=Lagenidium giganteum TaxID=4803 RepID=A0AAV2YMG6_9STRA|nr:TPA: hypothetical protein N0F65_008541 [Lagenidium giganteum]